MKETYAWVAYLDVFGFSGIVQSDDCLNAISKSLEKGHDYIAEVISRHSCEITFSAISDSIFLVYHTESCTENINFHNSRHETLQCCIEDISAISNKFVNLGMPLRGSVAFGKVNIINDKILVGEPVINAVQVKSWVPAPFILIPYKEFQDMQGCDMQFRNRITNIKLKNNALMGAVLIKPHPIDPLVAYAQRSLNKCAMDGPYDLADTWSQVLKHIETVNRKPKEE